MNQYPGTASPEQMVWKVEKRKREEQVAKLDWEDNQWDKAIYRFNAIPIKIQMASFTEIEKKSSNSYGPTTNPNSQSNLEQEEQSWRHHSSWFQYCKVIVTKTVWCWHKNRHIGQWNRIESLEINPHIYGQLISSKDAKNIQQGKDNLFNKWCWENWKSTC